MTRERTTAFWTGPAFYRIAPFAVFMLGIAGEEGLAFLHRHGLLSLSETARIWLYAPRVALVAALLFAYRRHYGEIDFSDLLKLRQGLISVVTGIVIFALWINMDWTLSAETAPPGYDPGLLGVGAERWLMIALRCSGAVLIVPIMEELFWRSFLLRYLIDNDFLSVAVGRLTWFSFLATTVLFGLEHHYLFAGMMAGALFSLVYFWTRSIAHCIVCHAVANLALAGYVLATGEWRFW